MLLSPTRGQNRWICLDKAHQLLGQGVLVCTAEVAALWHVDLRIQSDEKEKDKRNAVTP